MWTCGLLSILIFTSLQLCLSFEVGTPNDQGEEYDQNIFEVIVDPYLNDVSYSEPLKWPTFAGVTDFIIKQFNALEVPTLIKENLSPELAEEFLRDYTSGVDNEDVSLRIDQLIHKYGYPVEQHRVKTEDGYLLTIHRIPKPNKPVVFLMHGLLGSSDDWVIAGPESGIAYLLSSADYDVWLGNARGNKHSRAHTYLSPSKAEFWNFSWNEIGRYDLPAMIDYILNATNELNLKYVGHSQGTTTFFVMGSTRPEYNDKVSQMVALSAVAWMTHIKSPVVKLLSPVEPFVYSFLQAFGVHEVNPDTSVKRILENIMCGGKIRAQTLCSNFLFLVNGFDPDQMNVTNLPVIFGHVPAGAATKQLVHYNQLYTSGRFAEYDYGQLKNLEVYGSEYPPDYPVEKITAPVAIFAGDEDWLSNKTDVQILVDRLPNVKEVYNVPYKKFNHIDYLWAKDVKSLVFTKLLKLIQS